MMELYVLRQFVTFADAGTLSEAAEILHLSQPALSRNMKKLETDLGITLFERKKNQLKLNKNGEYVLDLARKLLADTDSFITKARDFDRRNRTISLGLCAPAPMWTLTPLITDTYPHMSLQTEIAPEDELLSGLHHDVYQLIVLPQKACRAPVCAEKEAFFCRHEWGKYALNAGYRFLVLCHGQNARLPVSDTK